MLFNGCEIFYRGDVCCLNREMLPLTKRGRWIVVNINTVSGNIIPMNMEMINNNLFHGMIKNMEGIKGTNVQDEQ